MRDRRGGGRHANQGGEAGEPTSLLPTGERRRSSPSLPSAATRCLLSRRLPRAAAPFLSAALTISPPPSRHSHGRPLLAWRRAASSLTLRQACTADPLPLASARRSLPLVPAHRRSSPALPPACERRRSFPVQ